MEFGIPNLIEITAKGRDLQNPKLRERADEAYEEIRRRKFEVAAGHGDFEGRTGPQVL